MPEPKLITSESASASHGDYVAPKTNRRLVDSVITVAEPSTWNSLPTDLRSADDFNSFSRQL